MKKSLFITLVLMGLCITAPSLYAENQPKSDAQILVNNIPQDNTHGEVDLDQLDEKTRNLFIKKAVWVDTFRKANAGEVSVEVFIYVTLELMEELGKSTEPEDKEMYDLCEKIVKSVTDAMNQVADQEEAEQAEENAEAQERA